MENYENTILHFSDLHGKLPAIPKKYNGSQVTIVISGDVCPNFPNHWIPGIKQGTLFVPTSWKRDWNFRQIDPIKEGQLQNEWIETILIPHFISRGISLDNILIISGNHDWANFEKYFINGLNKGAKNLVYRGIKIGLMVGVPQFTGEWYQELSEYELNYRINLIDKDTEILITHCPPYSILDRGHGEDRIGSQSLYTALFGKSVFEDIEPYFNKVRLNLFGHAHDSRGAKRFDFDNRQLRCYNACNTRFELNIK